ncbi:hypothetical protein CsSME_00001628 [Camellia sinensis var. sinensis]
MQHTGQAKPKADGVAFRDVNGKMHGAYLKKGSSMNEIILSAGALGSSQLLMLSGIGPKQHLMAHGIKVLIDQPMVGQGMADNPMNALFIPTLRPLEVSLIQVVGIPQSDSYYIEAASGSLFGYALAQMLANQVLKSDCCHHNGCGDTLAVTDCKGCSITVTNHIY